MVDVSGWVNPANLVTSQGSNIGNADFISIVVEAMKLQPCNPTFLQARDAIIQADRALFNGKYACAIWSGFAKRGMGVNAKTGGAYTDNSDIPAACSNPIPTTATTTAPTTSSQAITTTSKSITTSQATTIPTTTAAVSSSTASPKPTTTSKASGNTVAHGGS
ncbi:hypothetical protein HDU80_002595, partial [Chytriomyces hyalinus]